MYNEASPADKRNMSLQFMDSKNEQLENIAMAGRNMMILQEHEKTNNAKKQKGNLNNKKLDINQDELDREKGKYQLAAREKIIDQIYKNSGGTVKKQLSGGKKNGTMIGSGKWIWHGLGWLAVSSMFV